VRSPAWMVAYAIVLAQLGLTYASLVLFSPKAALFFALGALAAVVAAVVLTLRR
jgi:hypothetical protein